MRANKFIFFRPITVIFVWGLLLCPCFVAEGSTGEEAILEPILFLGGKEDDPHQAFFRPSAMKVDEEGNFYVLDRGNRRIVKFSKKGNFLKEIGRAGQGPGEFIDPLDLALEKDGNIYLLDNSGNYKVVIIDREGNYLNSFSISRSWGRIAIDDEGLIYLNLPEEGTLFSVYSKEGEKVASFGEITNYENLNAHMVLNTVLFCFDRRGFLNVLYRAKPILKQYDRNHKLVFQKEIKSADIDEINKNAARVKQRNDLPGFYFIPYFTDAILTNEGAILAKLSTTGIFHCFDCEGNLKKRVVSNERLKPEAAWIKRICMDAESNLYGVNPTSSLVFKYK